MTTKKFGRRIEFILAYEPSWFAESASALGMFLWGAFAFFTDDYDIRGVNWCIPTFAVAFGPIRLALLFGLAPAPRVVAAMVGFVFWGMCFGGLWEWKGFINGLGPLIALAFADLLTVAKFSMTVVQQWNNGRGDPYDVGR